MTEEAFVLIDTIYKGLSRLQRLCVHVRTFTYSCLHILNDAIGTFFCFSEPLTHKTSDAIYD